MYSSLAGKHPLRVAIDAQFFLGNATAGVESVLIGLVHALGQLTDGPEEYIIVGPEREPDWLGPYIGPNQQIRPGPKPKHPRPASIRRLVTGLVGRLGLTRQLAEGLGVLRRAGSKWPEVPLSDGFHESLGCDVVHFPQCNFTVCALPVVYNPHDLQHLHYPQYFTPSLIAWRETIYPAACHLAHTVVVASQWIKQDVSERYHVNAGKVQVIPWAPPTQAYPEPTPDTLATVLPKYRLHTPFALFPAATWEHKNHVRLLEALALLRDREGLVVRLVCTGGRTDFFASINRHLQALGLEDQVAFLGRVPPQELRALYRLAQFVVVPSLFEAASGPLYEAWQDGTPAACSNVTSLPEQAGDAALVFDPLSVEAIADAVARLATDQTLRDDLRQRGKRRLRDFSWERTAKAYRAVYRRAAGHALSEEDRWLLGWDWMRDPQRPADPNP